ncbi:MULTISPECIES: hypothetical protein [Methylococcus]|jgi:hypothetical protein|uniref:Lipoprotein n=2 Tax=Methylococcus capsulatus TaxID=414 RepID=Q608K1_METCA|nr:hypothetical protein [Methylococcus capsulatus]AAU92486.1 hypothetical protein MCA1489 [Methylococcus capsulatus str. Bath]QXP87816.1 hypothetical protein KW112_01280 [Methylococcus capsulatus]QXP90831.1 hypothetical protein KW114_01285 [Methylococcus capsulatus]QXP92445.1 hypothetical protein KW113_08500 [Methylococcus capsulatus]UQN12836.1 hypothetical protein M3M30_02995 [Methylococcus capsulatus]
MKRVSAAVVGLLFSANVFAIAQHYVRQDGGHVQHMKINKVGDEIGVEVDVDFEPVGSVDEGKRPCSHTVSGSAEKVADNELVLKKQVEGEARYCELKIHLKGDAAVIDQSKDCDYFLGTYCKFASEGKPLLLVK